ncbi:MAG: hypothetical protein ABFE07_27120, partial [Armatimonadia bacterium]
TKSVTQWARATGLTKDMVAHRLYVLGMSPEEALQAPRMSHNKRAISQRFPDGSAAVLHESLADAARSLKHLEFDTTKKALWMALKRGNGRAVFADCFWEYVAPDQSA